MKLEGVSQTVHVHVQMLRELLLLIRLVPSLDLNNASRLKKL